MIQLQILSGQMAGVWWTARHFPVRIGRAAGNELTLEESGVWDRHVTVEFNVTNGFTLRTESAALATVNQQSVQSQMLRVGDLIEIGSVRMRFWIAEPARCGLAWPAVAVWALIASVLAAEIWLILRLLA